MADRCFQSDYYRKNCPLMVGVKPYIPRITIDPEHSFVKKLNDWSAAYGKTSKENMTPPIIRQHPGNPLAVIEGEDKVDYVLTDKNEGGVHFADARARQLAKEFLWDLGEGMSTTGSGLPVDYFQKVIMLPTDGTRTGFEYDKNTYANAYSRQNSAKVAREQLPKNIKAVDLMGVVKEIMMSDMVVETIRQKMGYYDLSTNDRFENVSNGILGDLLNVDANHLSGTDDISLSPLYLRKISSPKFEPRPDGSLLVSTSFQYDFGKLFKEANFWPRRACRPSKFRKGSSVKFFRRVGMACPSFVSIGGTFVLEDELEERDHILKENQEYHIERMTKYGKEPFEKRTTYPTGHCDLVYVKGTKDAKTQKVARFQLFTKTRLDHRVVLPFVLVCEMIKSELVMYLTLLHIIFLQMTNPQSCRYEPSQMEPGEATVTAYQRLVETLFPCKAWWGNGAIKSGERWKLSTMGLYSKLPTFFAPTMERIENALDVQSTDERTQKKMALIKENLGVDGRPHYGFIPVVESNSLMFTPDDRAFLQNNGDKIVKENDVKHVFDMRNERMKGPLPRTVVSAVASLSAFEKKEESTRTTRFTADLQPPCTPLLKAETMRIFRIRSYYEGEQEPDYAVKIQGRLDALRLTAFRDQVTLGMDNVHEYLERLKVPEGEHADVIRRFEEEMSAEGGYEPEEGSEWERRDKESGEPLTKKVRLNDKE